MESQKPADSQSSRSNAPWFAIPEGHAISVEHPCFIKHNVERAIEMIGGPAAVTEAIGENSDRTFALSFRPEDPSARTVIANKKNADNVLLQITVPKRTGRKRKRGTNDPWSSTTTDDAPRKDASYMMQSIRDNPSKYNVTALSAISSMHIWRSMPDFAWSTSQLKILDDVKTKVLSQHYPTIKDFSLPQTHGLEDTTTLPPPSWSNVAIPQSYTYRQNPSVKVVNDPSTGQRIVRNTQAAPKIYSYQMQWDSKEYPKEPMQGLPPLTEQSDIFRKTVSALEQLFDQRPIWTRRALLNCLESDLSSFNVVRFCLAYVAYALRSGPWRDTYVKLGVDPRQDPKYRFYQSVMLQLVPRENQVVTVPAGKLKKSTDKPAQNSDAPDRDQSGAPTPVAQADRKKMTESRHTYARFWARSNDPNSHIFDGTSALPPDGKIWQLCDITDPQMVKLRDVPELHIRPVCEERYFGWYYNGTNAKMRVCLKAKVDALQNDRPLDPSLLEGFLDLPERVGVVAGPLIDTAQGQIAHVQNPDEGSARDISSAVAENEHLPMQQLSTNSEALSIYLGENATKQQLEWAALYRAFARTEPGHKPAAGGAGHGRLTKSKPVYRRSYRGNDGTQADLIQSSDNVPNLEPVATLGDPTQPINIEMEDLDEIDVFEDGPELLEAEQVLPSIELNGFDVEEEDGSELGLDIDPEIKVEGEETFPDFAFDVLEPKSRPDTVRA